jgi:hypothetical protein
METLEQRAGRWRKEVKESDCECSEEHLAEFARDVLLRAAELADEIANCDYGKVHMPYRQAAVTIAEKIRKQAE